MGNVVPIRAAEPLTVTACPLCNAEVEHRDGHQWDADGGMHNYTCRPDNGLVLVQLNRAMLNLEADALTAKAFKAHNQGNDELAARLVVAVMRIRDAVRALGDAE